MRAIATMSAAVGAMVFAAALPVPVEGAFPGTNGKLTFTRYEPGDLAGQIAVVPADAGSEDAVEILTSASTLNETSAWSPSGTCIAFSSDRDGGDLELYAMAADGSNPTRLTIFPGIDYNPTFSPDGTKLVFVSERNGSPDLFLFNLANGGMKLLAGGAAVDFIPVWSPDGSKIAFVSNRDGNFEVYTAAAAGGAPVRLTNDSGDELYPEWSPDGSRIAYTRTDSGTQGRDIWIMDADGQNQKSLISLPGDQSEPAFSPDGTRIAFAGVDGHIFVADAQSGGDVVEVTTKENVDDRQPDWQSVGGVQAGLCPTKTPAICGDQNADEQVKAGDALGILRAAVALPVVCPAIRCDTDSSGSLLTSSDALRTLRFAVGLPVTLECPEA